MLNKNKIKMTIIIIMSKIHLALYVVLLLMKFKNMHNIITKKILELLILKKKVIIIVILYLDKYIFLMIILIKYKVNRKIIIKINKNK